MDTFTTVQVNTLISLIRVFDPAQFSYDKTFIKAGKRASPEENQENQENQEKQYRQTFSAFITRLSPRVQGDLQNQTTFLKTLNKWVFCNVDSPVMFSDYLTRTFDQSPQCDIQILALSSLFVLITRHSLEYPGYYEKLYSLLAAPVFSSLHRERFLRLLEASLKSSKVSLQIQTSFLKRLLRVSLLCDVGIQHWAVGITINMVKKNKALSFLVDSDSKDRRVDPFLPESSLEASQAKESQLWELLSYKSHHQKDLGNMLQQFYDQLDNIDFIELGDMSQLTYGHLL